MWKKASLSVLHGLITFLGLWWYVNINFVTEPEEKEIQFFDWLSMLGGHTDTSILNRTILINTANEQELIDNPQDYGNTVITDRQVLTRFFHAVNQHSPKPRLILCDILFDEKTEHDSALQLEMEQLPQLMIPYVLENGHPILPVVEGTKTGLAEYYSHAEKMVKFQLMHPGNQKTLPVVADEWVSHRNYEQSFLGTLCAGRPVLGSIIPHYEVRPHMLEQSAAPIDSPDKKEALPTLPLYTLHDLTFIMGDSLQGAGFLENKFVVIGNFTDRDMHHTPIGAVPGVLILYNTFLTLMQGRQFLSLPWILFIVAAFSLLSFLVFFKGYPHYHLRGSGLIHYLFNSFLLKFLSIAVFVFIVSLISFLVFHTHVNILFISLYYSLLSDFIKYRKDEKSTLVA